jgi:uncharacterized protein YgiM (DUF1202 family)
MITREILLQTKKVSIILFLLLFLLAVSHEAGAKAVYVKEAAVNLRKERSTLSNVITILGRDEKIEVIEENLNWYKVNSDRGIGWIAKSLVSDTPPIAEELKYEKEKTQVLTEKIARLQGEADETKKQEKKADQRVENLIKENRRLLAENKHLSSTKEIIRVILGIVVLVIGWLFGFLTGFYKKQSDNRRLESMMASTKHQ